MIMKDRSCKVDEELHNTIPRQINEKKLMDRVPLKQESLVSFGGSEQA